MRIVVLHYADQRHFSPIQQLNDRIAFRLHFPNARHFNLFGEVDDMKWERCRHACARAHKVVIQIHGSLKSTTKALLTGLEADGSISYRTLARQICRLISPNRELTIMLLMCYGARSREYERNHRRTLGGAILRSGFAYKLFKLICKSRTEDLRLTAWTGTVFVDYFSILCQPESAVRKEIELEALLDRIKEKGVTVRNLGWGRRTGKPKWDIKIERLEDSSRNLKVNYGKLEYLYSSDNSVVTIREIYPRKRRVYEEQW